MTTSVAGPQTAQLLGFHPQELWVITHGLQVVLLGGGLLPLCRGSVSTLWSPSQQSKYQPSYSELREEENCSYLVKFGTIRILFSEFKKVIYISSFVVTTKDTDIFSIKSGVNNVKDIIAVCEGILSLSGVVVILYHDYKVEEE